MSVQGYDQSDDNGPWIDFEEYIYPSKRTASCASTTPPMWTTAASPRSGFSSFTSPATANRAGHGHWEPGAPDELELYVEPIAQNVIHVEGEACADFVNEKLREAGLTGWIATTSPGGCKAWRPELAEVLQGQARVRIARLGARRLRLHRRGDGIRKRRRRHGRQGGRGRGQRRAATT